MKITEGELDGFITFIHDKCGIVLDHSKAYLMESRFAPLLAEYQFSSYDELLEKAKKSPELINRVIDTITTNETSFFRDQRPFDLLHSKVLPAWLDKLPKDHHGSLHVWSAACSTGQEIYSIAITIREFLRNNFSKHTIKLTGTDIANSAIAKAKAGRYSQMEVNRGIMPSVLQKYFIQDQTEWKICSELREIVSFQRQNLLKENVKSDKFDVIFCRNVAIYFSAVNRKILFDKIADQLKDTGVLIIGSTESLFGICDRLTRAEHDGTSYYLLRQ